MFRSYDIENMPINVFDTPGFLDSDECRNNENKKQIASQIGNKIDMFAYWLISDLIPKKSEKFEFWKNFVTMFFSVKN